MAKISKVSGCAITMKGFPYLVYYGTNSNDVEKFVSPCKVVQTKRFNITKKLNINFPDGSKAIEIGNVIVRLTNKRYLILLKEEFELLFFDA